MTIFDLIRYPVSNPPSAEELKSLPAEIFNDWTEWMGWYTDPTSMSFLFRARPDSECTKSIAHLRKLLLEKV